MANYQIKFIDLDSGEDTLQVFKNDKEVLNLKNDFIRICIEKGQDYPIIFDMDKSTAIKFAKTLRTEINKITESEVKNEA